MNILVLSHMYPNSVNPNYGIFIHNQIKHLSKAGCFMKVISPVPYAPAILKFKTKWKQYNELLKHDLIEGIHVVYPRYIHLPGSWYHGFSCYAMYSGIRNILSTVIHDFHPDVIHSHNATADGYVGLQLKNKYKLPLVCSLRGSDINDYPYRNKLTMALTKKVISNANQIVSVSYELKSASESIARPKEPISVLYNGCDLIKFSFNQNDRDKIREDLGILKNDIVFIFVGDLIVDKGIVELIKAFIVLSDKYANIHLIILGEGSLDQYIKNMTNSSVAHKKVHFIGVRPNDEITSWLSASDVFTLPSYHEGLPNVLLEAMSCSLPVVTSNVGGIPEIVKDGDNGILIDAKSVDSLCQALEYMIKNIDLAKKMGNKGRSFVLKHISWEKNAQNMIDIYKRVIYDN